MPLLLKTSVLVLWFAALDDIRGVQPDQGIDGMMLTSEKLQVISYEWQGYINYCDLIEP